jgi:hypothetical protein
MATNSNDAGTGGNDTMFGGPGDDTIHGNQGNDLLDGGPGADVLSGGKGRDTLFGGPGDDTIHGNQGNDLVDGGRGADVLFGDAGHDTLLGGNGRDTLSGGAGDDFLDGGRGRDTAVYDDVADAYTISRLPDGRILVQSTGAASGDGTDVLESIEFLRFADRTIDTSTIPCFAAGTQILTDAGEVAVEALRIGEQVALWGGGFAAVTWTGRRTVEIGTHAWPDLVRPVRVRAGALAEGVPHRDLLLSPEHALAIEDVLVPVGLLVNGRSIVQERGGDRITYVHVALPAHAVLLAEGAPAESYLDLGHRRTFEEEAGAMDPHTRFASPVAAAGCAPRIEDGPLLEAVRARLSARATEIIAMEETTDSDLHLLADGRVIRAAPDGLRFDLPAGTREVRIVSRACCPAASPSVCAGDRRMLGVALFAIRLRGAGGGEVEVPMQDASLWRGFHAVERVGGVAYRWTDGDAVLPESWLAPFAGMAITVELGVCGTQRHWVMRQAA